MHPKSTATQALVLDRLPSGELAWLRPEPQPVARPMILTCHVLTHKARDWLARERHGSAVRLQLVLDQPTATVRHNPPVCAPHADALVWNIAGECRFIVQPAASPEFVAMSASREQLRCRCHKPHAVTPGAHERAVTEVVR